MLHHITGPQWVGVQEARHGGAGGEDRGTAGGQQTAAGDQRAGQREGRGLTAGTCEHVLCGKMFVCGSVCSYVVTWHLPY